MGVWLTAGAALAVSVYAYYQFEAAAAKSERHEALATISQLKSDQISQWRSGLLQDAVLMAHSTGIIRELFGDHSTAAARQELRRLLDTIVATGYADAAVVAPGGRVLDSARDPSRSTPPAVRDAEARALTTSGATLSDLYRGDDDRIYIAAVSAVRDAAGQPVATVRLESIASSQLFPMIQSWPTPSPSGETLMVARDGQDVVFLNDLRHQTGTALRLRHPISGDLPAAQAVLGRTGFVEGRDYRGVTVVGDIRTVPDSQWFVVSKVDAAEILSEARERTAAVATMLTLILLLAWAVYVSFERKRRAELFRSRFDFVEQAEAVGALGTFDFDLVADRWSSSPNLDRMFGLDRSVSRNFQGWRALLHPDDREDTSQHLQTAIGAKGEFDRDYRIIRPSDGIVRWVHGRGRVEAGPDGALRMIGTIQDITERHAAFETQRLQVAALNAAADAVVITDPAGLIEWVNAAFTETTGYSAEEALGKNPRDLLKSGVQEASYYRDLWATISAGKVWRGELTNRRKDGSTYPEEMTITPVRDAKGQITHFVAIKRDVTEKQKLEGRFLQAQKMEVVGRLAGGVAHDFNNLLTVINGTADLAMSDLADDHPLKQDLQAIHDAGERAAVLTAQLLAFSRKQILKHEVARLGDLVGRMHGLIRRLVGEDIAVHISGSDEGRVLIDSGQFTQIILNLAVNARDAMPTGGKLTIQTSDVEVDDGFVGSHHAARSGPHVMVTISDSGCGMDAMVKARLFEPFFTTKEAGKGTGLGLSTVYGIVKQSSGTISVYSEPGQGTVFKILIPRTDQPAQGAPRPDLSRRESGGEAILLVEDAVDLRQLASRILLGAGYEVIEAGTGPEALALLSGRAQSVQLLLTDVVLPEMSGRELADRVARHGSGIKVLYTSGYTDDAVLRHGVLANDAHFIAKPYSAVGLRRKVREVLDEPARSTSEG